MKEIIQLQRATVAEHIQAETAKDWRAVYDTFVQNEDAYYDVAPLATRFQGMFGVKAFTKRSQPLYQIFTFW